MSAQRACFLSQTLMDHETGRRHNTASQKKLHTHGLQDKTTATDRVSRSHSPSSVATCPRQSSNTTCVSSLEEVGLLSCQLAHGVITLLQVWIATIRLELQLNVEHRQLLCQLSCLQELRLHVGWVGFTFDLDNSYFAFTNLPLDPQVSQLHMSHLSQATS